MPVVDDKNDASGDRPESAAARVTQADIFNLIIDFCDKPTLAELSLVNHSFDDLVTPKLFRYIAIDYRNGRHNFDLPSGPAQGEEQADRTRNDLISITARFRRALSFARVLTIHGHKETDCQASRYTQGFPNQMIEALTGVHTVRLIPTIRETKYLGSDLSHSDARLCGETNYGNTSCNLLHLLRGRYVIISHSPTKPDLPFELYETMGRNVTEPSGEPSRPTTFGKNQVAVSNTDNLTHYRNRGWFPTPFAHIPLTVMIQGGWGNTPANQAGRTEALLSNAFTMTCQIPESEIRFACDKEDVERLQNAHTMHAFRRGSSGAWEGKEIKRFRERVTFVDREEVIKEKWVEAFRGAYFAEWF